MPMLDKRENFHFASPVYKTMQAAYIPEKLYVSMEQGGLPCIPLVRIGDVVTEGQLIAAAKNKSPPIHSPVPGRVAGFTACTMPNGKVAGCIVIELQGSFTFEGKEPLQNHWEKSGAEKLTSLIKSRGIINTFDSTNASLAWQIESAGPAHKMLGVRLFDYDPSCSIDSFVARAFIQEILEGVQICARALTANSIAFFYDARYWAVPDAGVLKALFGDLPCYFFNIDSRLYPSGSRLYLQKLVKNTNIKVYLDSLTALSVYRGIKLSLPVMQTLVEVNGSALYESRIFSVKIGTPIGALLKECGGTEKKPAKIVLNGLINGIASADIKTPVTKYLKTLTVLDDFSIPDQQVSKCIRCARCRNVCPVGILPDKILEQYLDKRAVSQDVSASVHLCNECALCNATCPSRLPLVQIISMHKDKDDALKI